MCVSKLSRSQASCKGTTKTSFRPSLMCERRSMKRYMSAITSSFCLIRLWLKRHRSWKLSTLMTIKQHFPYMIALFPSYASSVFWKSGLRLTKARFWERTCKRGFARWSFKKSCNRETCQGSRKKIKNLESKWRTSKSSRRSSSGSHLQLRTVSRASVYTISSKTCRNSTICCGRSQIWRYSSWSRKLRGVEPRKKSSRPVMRRPASHSIRWWTKSSSHLCFKSPSGTMKYSF